MNYFACVLLALCLSLSACQAAEPVSSVVGKGFARTSVNAVIFRYNSICSDKDFQFTSWYAEDGTIMLARRKVGDETWETKATPFKGAITDAHNAICIDLDGDGYLHIAWAKHNQPLNYARSKEPHSLELSDALAMTGEHENRLTYPQFFSQPSGDLLFLYRDGASGNGNLVLNHYDVKEKKWDKRAPNLIDGEGKRNAYWQACTDAKGTMHLSWVWRETGDVATNHDLCYAKSADGGKTWTKSDGTSYQLPIKEATAEIASGIPQKSELMNQTAMCADSAGHPYIATYFRKPGDAAPQYYMAYHDGNKWSTNKVLDRTLDFKLAGGGTKRVPISRPLILARNVDGKDQAYVVFRDEERGSKVTVAICNDLANPSWTARDLTDFSVGMWEPTCDPAAWRNRGELVLFIQNVGQGDGEKLENLPPQDVSVLTWKP